jgi:hypothetical protein
MAELFNQSPTQKALYEKIRSLCLSLPGSSERISHGAPTFFIGDKLSYVQYRVNHHGDGRIALWCSAPTGVQSLLIESTPEVYFRPPYVGHLGWVGLRLDREVVWADISGTIGEAYMNRAPKKYREMLTNEKYT